MSVRSELAAALEGALLTARDLPPAATYNPAGRSPFLLVGDHAGTAIPALLGNLGLGEADLGRHIAVDIGTAALGRRMADMLDAVFIHQRYSRLVVDCNRAPDSDEAVPAVSDGTPIPGNTGLTAAARSRRVADIHAPYQRAIAAELARRAAAGEDAILVSLHSFTPILGGQRRPWHIGILHDGGDTRFARAMLLELAGDAAISVGDNQPYRMDQTDFTVPLHAYAPGLRYVEVEVRQDLLEHDPGVAGMAETLSRTLSSAARRARQ